VMTKMFRGAALPKSFLIAQISTTGRIKPLDWVLSRSDFSVVF